LKPKEEVLQFIDSLSPYQWRSYLSYILRPSSRLPEPVRMDITSAAIGEGRCAVLSCFEEAYDEVDAYVGRVCDLKTRFEVVPSNQATLARLRDAVARETLLVVNDLDQLSQGFLQEYISLARFRVAGALGVSSNYGLIIYGKVPRRTRYGNPEAATYNKLGRAVYRMLEEQKRAFGFHIVTPDLLGPQRRPVLDPPSPYSDAYLVSSFFSRYREKFIVDTGIKSIWR